MSCCQTPGLLSKELGMYSLDRDCTDIGLLIYTTNPTWNICAHIGIPLLHVNTYVQFVAEESNFHGQRSP